MATSKADKLKEWLLLTLKSPGEAVDRVSTLINVKSESMLVTPPQFQTVPMSEVLAKLASLKGVQLDSILQEAADVEAAVTERISSLQNAPIDHVHSADFALARVCYAAVRIMKPETIVETGVAYGNTSAFILEALEKNGRGTLHSVDLPPLGPNVDDFVGILIRDEVRPRWKLTRGTSKRVLPPLLKTLGRLDMFVHDSLHTYKNILFELELVTPHLRSTAVVIADDIDENPAFTEWSNRHHPGYSAVVQEEVKQSLVGIAIFTGEIPDPA